MSFKIFWHADRTPSDSATVPLAELHLLMCVPGADELLDQINREDPDSSSAHAAACVHALTVTAPGSVAMHPLTVPHPSKGPAQAPLRGTTTGEPGHGSCVPGWQYPAKLGEVAAPEPAGSCHRQRRNRPAVPGICQMAIFADQS